MVKMEQPKAIRARKPNYTHEEISVLLEEVATNKVVIQSALTGEVTSQLKGQQWQDIAVKVSNCGVCLRTPDQVREKFSEIKKEFFIREKRRRGTGGGPPVQEKPFDELLTFIIGKESALFSGLCAKCLMFHVLLIIYIMFSSQYIELAFTFCMLHYVNYVLCIL